MGKVLEKKQIMPAYGMVRSNASGPVARARNFASQYSAIREGIKLGRQMVSRGGSWASAGRSGPASFSPTWRANPSPPYQYKRRPVSQGGPVPKRTKVSGVGTQTYNPRGGSGGTMYKKKKTRRVSKYKKKKRGKKGRANFISGIQSRIETTQKVQDLQAVYVGHTTMAPTTVFDIVCTAIAKALCIKEGFAPSGLTDGIGINTDMEFQIIYWDGITATAASSYDVTLLPNPTLSQMRDSIKGILTLAINGYDKKQQFQRFRWFSNNNVGGTYRFHHEFNMSGMKIDGFMKSTFSFQNATPSAIGSSSTDVNNANPVRCVPYFGKGNGTFWRNRTSTTGIFENFFGETTSGAISVVSAEAVNKVLDEPPASKFFLHAKRGKGFVLQPGEIRTVQLNSPVSMTLTKFIQYFDGYDEDLLLRHGMGKFQFFGIEKVLSTNIATGASDVKIVIDYEVDYATTFKATLTKYKSPTSPINTSFSLVTKG